MAINQETVLGVQHHTDQLLTFQTTRDPGFRFESGQFTMIGLEVDGKPIMRAYSIASSKYEDHLNFISIKVPDGPLTSRLQHIEVGDKILVSTKAVGTLTIERLTPAHCLYLLATGTGLAPFMSIIADPATYEKFQHVQVVHCCRTEAELVYGDYIENLMEPYECYDGMYNGNMIRPLFYHPRTTQETVPSAYRGRIIAQQPSEWPDYIHNKVTLDNDLSRVMICGGQGLLTDLTEYFTDKGWAMGALDTPGDFIIEKSFVEAK